MHWGKCFFNIKVLVFDRISKIQHHNHHHQLLVGMHLYCHLSAIVIPSATNGTIGSVLTPVRHHINSFNGLSVQSIEAFDSFNRNIAINAINLRLMAIIANKSVVCSPVRVDGIPFGAVRSPLSMRVLVRIESTTSVVFNACGECLTCLSARHWLQLMCASEQHIESTLFTLQLRSVR